MTMTLGFVPVFVLLILGDVVGNLGVDAQDDGSWRPFSKRCKAGTVYTINDPSDMESLRLHRDLECIFAAGKLPTRIPYGRMNLQIIQIFNTRLLNPLLELMFAGKYITRVPCTGGENATQASILWNNIGTTPRMPAGVRLGNVDSLMENLNPDEVYDGQEALVVDYGDDIQSRCPAYVPAQHDFIVPKTETGNFYPLDQAFDLVRLVGVAKDGGRIYLAKVYMRSAFDSQVNLLSFITFLNYDLQVNPEFQPGQALDPLPRSFSYKVTGLVTLARRLFPVTGAGIDERQRAGKPTLSTTYMEQIERNRQLGKNFREARRNDGPQRRREIDNTFIAAYKQDIYQ